MVIHFSEEEKKYIIADKGDWHVSPKCPGRTKKKIEKKIGLISSQQKAKGNKREG